MAVGGYATPLTVRYLGSDVSLRRGFNCHTIPTLRLFIPNSLTVYHHSLLSEVSSFWLFFFGLRWSVSNHCHCSLLMCACPKRHLIKCIAFKPCLAAFARFDYMLAFISASMAFMNPMSSIFAKWHYKIDLRTNTRSNPTNSDTICRVFPW
jgi:hypothetical protein